MKLILASNNAGKVVEFREILAGTGIEVIPQREAGCDFEVDETGDTFEENAFLKAEAAMKATGLPPSQTTRASRWMPSEASQAYTARDIRATMRIPTSTGANSS